MGPLACFRASLKLLESAEDAKLDVVKKLLKEIPLNRINNERDLATYLRSHNLSLLKELLQAPSVTTLFEKQGMKPALDIVISYLTKYPQKVEVLDDSVALK